MPIIESVYVAFFLLVIVFLALFCLYICVRLFSVVFIRLENMRKSGAESDSMM